MANPRQRRKARSSSHRPVSLSQRAKKNLKKLPPIRGPKALQDAWDKKKTVRQNYAALGLVHTLNPTASGGLEQVSPRITSATSVESGNITDTPDAFSATRKGLGRIIRDEAGNVVQVALSPEDTGDQFKDSPEVMREPEISSNARENWVTNLGRQHDGPLRLEKSVTVEVLERVSVAHMIARHSSVGEVKYLERLVDKYGSDIEQMARDRKLNAEQRTAGELRRGLKRAGLEVPKGEQ